MTHVPILVLNCAADVERRKSVADGLIEQNPIWIDAVDARWGAGVFQPYLHLLGDQFWQSDQIKPGAFACFISHRLAWQYIVDHDLDHALIMEDDSHLIKGWQDVIGEPHADLVFVNNRAIQWAPDGDIQQIISPPSKDRARAIGGDGYVLSQKGAELLLMQSALDQVQCGVDWYMAYAGLNTSNLHLDDVQAVPEVMNMFEMFGPRKPVLHTSIAQTPCVINAGTFISSIKHKHKIDIKSFRQDIENA